MGDGSCIPLHEGEVKLQVGNSFLQDILDEKIAKFIAPEYDVLEVGTGDRGSTERFARNAKEVIAFYPDEKQAKAAGELAAKDGNSKNVRFTGGDLSRIKEILDRQFDVVVSVRRLTTLPSSDDQLAAADSIMDLVKPGGLLLVSEGWEEGWAGLDEMRQQAGLDGLKLASGRLLLSKKGLVRHFEPKAELVGCESVGFYIYMSCVLKPMVSKAGKQDNPIGRAATRLMESFRARPNGFEMCDYPGVCVFRKRDQGG